MKSYVMKKWNNLPVQKHLKYKVERKQSVPVSLQYLSPNPGTFHVQSNILQHKRISQRQLIQYKFFKR